MPATILLIENDDDFRDSLAFVLKARGFDVRAFSTGRGGIAAAFEERPGLILLDLILGDTEGVAVAAELRSHPDFGAVPIVAVSGAVDTDLFDQTLGDFDDFLQKPFLISQLFATIDRLLSSPAI